MRVRLIIILSFLVVVPTAILTLMAGKALSNWEDELNRSLAASASRSIELINQQIYNHLESELDEIRNAMSDALSRGSKMEFGKPAEPEAAALNSMAITLEEDIATVETIYLFMNPWGFLHPQDESSVPVPDSELGSLISELRKQISTASSLTAMIRFSHSGSIYCFSLLRDRQGLYAGFKVNQHALHSFVAEAARSISGDGFNIAAKDLPDKETGIRITDSFGGQSEGFKITTPAKDEVLASVRLDKPFDIIELTAVPEQSPGARKSAMLRARLFRWGIILLAMAVLLGVGVVLWEASLEVKRARERSDFMIGVSHDLRTPISSIKILSDGMLMGTVPEPEKQKKFLTTIAAECDHLADMVERVLFFMKQEHGSAVYSFAPVAAGRLVKTAVEMFNERTHGQAAVNLDIEPDLPEIEADEHALLKVMQNLLGNAEKYSMEAKDDGMIQIDVKVQKAEEKGKDWIQISVRDYGIGIEKHELKKIFKKFYRASIEMNGKVRGIGLGLALCRDIIRAHKGRINIWSEKDEGCEVKVLLPIDS